jgi:hypothetical protein
MICGLLFSPRELAPSKNMKKCARNLQERARITKNRLFDQVKMLKGPHLVCPPRCMHANTIKYLDIGECAQGPPRKPLQVHPPRCMSEEKKKILSLGECSSTTSSK